MTLRAHWRLLSVTIAIVVASTAVFGLASLSAGHRSDTSPSGSSPPATEPTGVGSAGSRQSAQPLPTPAGSVVASEPPHLTWTTYQEASKRIAYAGRWSITSLPAYSGGRAKWSKQRGASATLAFAGTAVKWIGPRGPTRGRAKVYIDGHYVATVNTYASHFSPSLVLFSTTFPTQQAHTMAIVVMGTAGHPTVAIDTLVVRVVVPAATPTGGTPAPSPTATPRSTPAPLPPPSSQYPPDSTLRYVATPSLARPAYLDRVVDPIWGTTTECISNIAGVRHEYSRIPAWNSDQSRILLDFTYPGRMLNGTTYADLGTFWQISGAIWANTDPNKLFGTDAEGNGNRFYSQNATTGALTVLHKFTGYAYITIGDGEGAIDDNDRYVALLGATAAGAQALIVYDIQSNTVVSTLSLPTRPDNAQISRKGNYVTVGWQSDGSGPHQGIERYTRELTDPINLTPFSRHGDNALDANGNEIYVANSPYVDSFLLSSGAATRLLPGKTAFEYGHTSGRNIDRPGWVYLSVYDNAATAGRPGHDQVIAVKTDGSGTVEVFAFEHHTNTTVYADQPQAVPSRDGTRVLFASEWGARSVFAYVAGR